MIQLMKIKRKICLADFNTKLQMQNKVMAHMKNTTWDDYIQDKGVQATHNEYQEWLLNNQHKLNMEATVAIGGDPELTSPLGKVAMKCEKMRRYANKKMCEIMADAMKMQGECVARACLF